MHKLLLFPLLLFATVLAFSQGPIDGYMKSKGETDIAIGLSATGASRFIGGDGQVHELPFNGTLLGGFLAHGITDKLDLVASVPFVITSSAAGLQDAGLFLKGHLLRIPIGESNSSNIDLMAAAGIQFPLSNYEVVAAGAIGQRAKIIQPRFVAQYNRPGFFASTVLGYNYRFDELDEQRLMDIQRTRPAYLPNQPSDFVTALFRVGIPTSKFYADAWLELQRTFDGTDFVLDVEELPQAYDVDYQQIGGTLYYSEGPRYGFAASGATFLGGRNTSKLWRISGTLVIKLGRE